MTQASFKVAVGQSVSRIAKVEENLQGMDTLCAAAAAQGADLILFPEGSATGYSYGHLSELLPKVAEPFGGPLSQALLAMSQRYGLVVCAGMFERVANHYYNIHLVAWPDGRIERQRKGVRACREPQEIRLGRERKRFEWKGVHFGILVCADSSLPGYEAEYAALGGIDLLLHPSAGYVPETGPAMHAQIQEEDAAVRARAHAMAESIQASYAVANPIGFNGEYHYPGNSWIIHPASTGHPARYLPGTALEEEMTPGLIVSPLPLREHQTTLA